MLEIEERIRRIIIAEVDLATTKGLLLLLTTSSEIHSLQLVIMPMVNDSSAMAKLHGRAVLADYDLRELISKAILENVEKDGDD